MDFSLSDEEQMLKDSTQSFVQDKLIPHALVADANGSVDNKLLDEIAGLGYCGIATPAEYGGAGFNWLSYVVVIEEMAKVDPAFAALVAVSAGPIQKALIQFGSEIQKTQTLSQLAAGEKWGTIALYDADMNRTAPPVHTTAVRKGDGWILNGTKTFVINGSEADYYLVFAQISGKETDGGLAAFLIDSTLPGLTFKRIKSTSGTNALPIAHLTLSDYRAPSDAMVGTPADGNGILVAVETMEHLYMAAISIGIAVGAYNLAKEYGAVRTQFNTPIIQFEALRTMLAEMNAMTDAARLLLYKASLFPDNQVLATEARLVATQTASKCVHHANQIHGGYGYIKEYPIEKLYRDQLFAELVTTGPVQQKLTLADALLNDV